MTEHTTQLEHLPTTATWRQWEGQAVNGEFPLYRYLGSSGHSAVFLTSYGESNAQAAAIKLILDDPEKAEEQLRRWGLARGLSHPNLLRLFQSGHCQLDGVRLLYVVMEYAEEDLSQLLPHRALRPSEASEMLRPALDALGYLHGMGLVHGHVKPANIMACANQVKLSSDGICRSGESTSSPGSPNALDNYGAPDRRYSPASDAWALGMTLIEVLTQHLPAWERSAAEAEPVVPEMLGEPFVQIARRCLRRNPSLRLRASDIASRLEPLPAQVQPEITKPKQAAGGAHYFVWFVAIGLLLAAIMASSIRWKHHHARQTQQSVVGGPHTQKQAKPAAIAKLPEVSLQHPAPQTDSRASIQATPKKKISVDSAAPDKAMHPVLPDVPQKALDTIRGTVRVGVKVSVDPSGRVAEATLDSPGPSRYFANLALQAAVNWTFGPANLTGPGSPRQWILHFEFSPSGPRARPVRAIP
ncbi:MAG: protein kinase [Candidatus Acidiferrales bacterium]|jgi:TonB family protein